MNRALEAVKGWIILIFIGFVAYAMWPIIKWVISYGLAALLMGAVVLALLGFALEVFLGGRATLKRIFQRNKNDTL